MPKGPNLMSITLILHRSIFKKIASLVVASTILCGTSGALASHPQNTKGHKTLYKAGKRDKRAYTTNQLLKAYLERSAFRHKVLSQNMANVNTPGYKADEVAEATDYDDLMDNAATIRRVSIKRTSSKHLPGSHGSDSKIASEKLKNPYEIKPNGNNVSIAQQMTKLSQNQQDYNAAVKAYSTTNSLFSTVLGK